MVRWGARQCRHDWNPDTGRTEVESGAGCQAVGLLTAHDTALAKGTLCRESTSFERQKLPEHAWGNILQVQPLHFSGEGERTQNDYSMLKVAGRFTLP